MIWHKSCFASLILMITGVGYGQTAIQNPSFEQGELGGIQAKDFLGHSVKLKAAIRVDVAKDPAWCG